jgi:hypothetical protein
MSPRDQAKWERWQRVGFWRYTALFGTLWFWMTMGLWALLQCVFSDCAYVAGAFTFGLPHTLAAWGIGGFVFGAALWFTNKLRFRPSSRK